MGTDHYRAFYQLFCGTAQSIPPWDAYKSRKDKIQRITYHQLEIGGSVSHISSLSLAHSKPWDRHFLSRKEDVYGTAYRAIYLAF